jgi:prepilin-type N-terminal cleavage/methylation domain-containing protein/prepilin-type processing-associated H-X9-DG protein
MIYIHKLESVLSSNFLMCSSFSLLLGAYDQYHAFLTEQSMPRNSRLSRAFTLIEVIVVLAIIAILMSMVYPMYLNMSERAKATKEMSNLRQIGLATQTYMNDSDGVLPGSIIPAVTWMSQLRPKYMSVWAIFQSPFDKRPRSEAGNDTTPVSYGINAKVYVNNVPISATRISKPTAFILFAPAQNNSTTVAFQGAGTTAAPGVYLLGNGNSVTSSPGGVPTGGTHNSRKRINALFADLHCETMTWTAFTSTVAIPNDPDQWTPYVPYP